MLERMKDLGGQLTTKANEAVEGITATVKGGVESLGDAATGAAAALNDKAVRSAVAQMRHALEVAIDDLRQRPLPHSPVTLTASVNVGVTALQMEIVVPAAEPEGAAGEAAAESPQPTP